MSRLKPLRLGPPYGGVDKMLLENMLENNTATITDNFVLRNKALETAKGWQKYTNQILTDGAASPALLTSLWINEFRQNDGQVDVVLITNRRAYRFDEPTQYWVPITQGAAAVSTTMTANSAVNATALSVVSSVGFSAGQEIIVGFGTTNYEHMIVTSTGVGVINVSRPSWVTAGTGCVNTHAIGDTIYNIATMTYTASSAVDVTIDDNILYFTDGVNPIQKWDPSTNFHINLPGLQIGDTVNGIGVLTSALKAKYIRAFSTFLIIGNLTEEGNAQPSKVRWSQIGNYAKWSNEVDGTGQSGAFRFTGTGVIQGLRQLKREIIIKREVSIEAMSYIGLPDIWAFRSAITDTGLLAPLCDVDYGDFHAFLGNDNIWEFNGNSKNAIGDPIKDDFYSKCNPTQLPNSRMFFYKEKNEIWLSFSTTNTLVHDKAYVFNTLFRKWSGPRDMNDTTLGRYFKTSNVTWDTIPGAWDNQVVAWDSGTFQSNSPLNLMANDQGLVFILETSETKNGTTISKRYESKRMDMGRADLLKSVQRVRIGADTANDAALSVFIGTAFSESDPIVWNGPYTLNVTQGYEPYVYMDVYGRFFKVRIDTTDPTIIQDVEVQFYFRETI